MLLDGAKGMAFEQFFGQLISTTPTTRSMVEAAVLELHQSGEIRALDERGNASKARFRLKANHVLRLPSQRTFNFSNQLLTS